MSQTANPYGLSQVAYKGGKFRASVSTYYISSGYALSFGQGDPVQMGTGGYVGAYSGNVPTVQAANTMTLGTFVSVKYVNTQGQTVISPYWPASTVTFGGQPAIVTVNDLPLVVYQVQGNASLQLTAPATAIGKNYNLNPVAPNPATAQSLVSLNISSGGNAAAWATCKIVGLADAKIGGTNSWYDPYPDLLVIINNHAYKIGTNGTN